MGPRAKLAALVALAAAPCSFGAVTLSIPDQVATPGTTINFAALFDVTPAESISSIGYQVALTITGPDNGLTINGATAASLYNGQAGAFAFVPASGGMPMSDIYILTDFLLSGNATIQDGAVFATFSATVAAGAVGPYDVSWYLIDDGAYKSMIMDSLGSELPVIYDGGTISVPEPTSLAGLVLGGMLLGRRRRD